ncbi:hypothetical protein DY000_02006185 [Brassica cretica]|uniref:Uncharacterized protein n=1 Tax=Brassica cretica TaxID=69181 RepID=A0ABQ7CHB1_BRACR|nr:hypothetical protein DY000_02006185 [Brassica cretica]
MTDDGSSFDPNFTPLNTMDLESQRLIGVLLAAEEADDGSSDGTKKRVKGKPKPNLFILQSVGGERVPGRKKDNGKKKKIQEEQLDSEGEFEEDVMENEMENGKEGRQCHDFLMELLLLRLRGHHTSINEQQKPLLRENKKRKDTKPSDIQPEGEERVSLPWLGRD